MDRTVPYDATKEALLKPGRDAISLVGSDLDSITTVCCESSRIAYKQFESDANIEEEVRAALEQVGFSDLGFFNSDLAHAFAARNPDREFRLLAFRGTNADDPSDICTDAEAKLVPWRKDGQDDETVHVHFGFQTALESILPRVMRWLHDNPARTTVLTGHSLGAPLATLAASHYDQASVIAFGSPRVGDDAFGHRLSDRNIVRYVDCCDMVCRVPPSLLGYSHVGTEAYINRLGLLDPNADTGDDAKESDQTKARIDYLARYAWKIGNVGFRDLADHAPVNYVAAIRYARSRSVLGPLEPRVRTTGT